MRRAEATGWVRKGGRLCRDISICFCPPRPGMRQPPMGGSGGVWGVLRLLLVAWMAVIVGEVVKMTSTAYGLDKSFKTTDGKFNVRSGPSSSNLERGLYENASRTCTPLVALFLGAAGAGCLTH